MVEGKIRGLTIVGFPSECSDFDSVYVCDEGSYSFFLEA